MMKMLVNSVCKRYINICSKHNKHDISNNYRVNKESPLIYDSYMQIINIIYVCRTRLVFFFSLLLLIIKIFI